MIWRLIWNVSECTHFPLGRLAPFVLGKAIGASSWSRVDVAQTADPENNDAA